jgi:hypothetical protein
MMALLDWISMRHFIKFGAAVALGLLLIGCAGSGGGIAFADTDYVGDWTGTWTSNSGLAGSGTATVAIDDNGNFSGNSVQTGGSNPATLAGSVTVEGSFSGTIQFSSGSPIAASGTFSTPDPDTLTGTLTQGTGSGAIQITYSLTRN